MILLCSLGKLVREWSQCRLIDLKTQIDAQLALRVTDLKLGCLPRDVNLILYP